MTVAVDIAMVYHQQHRNASSGHYSRQAGGVAGHHDLIAHGEYLLTLLVQ